MYISLLKMTEKLILIIPMHGNTPCFLIFPFFENFKRAFTPLGPVPYDATPACIICLWYLGDSRKGLLCVSSELKSTNHLLCGGCMFFRPQHRNTNAVSGTCMMYGRNLHYYWLPNHRPMIREIKIYFIFIVLLHSPSTGREILEMSLRNQCCLLVASESYT